MNRSEFIEKHRAYKKELDKYVLRFVSAIPVFFLVMGATVFFTDKSIREDPFWNSVFCVCLLLPMLGAAWWLFWIPKMVANKHGLRCHDCKAGLSAVSAEVAQIVIASGKCRCGYQVLDEPEPEDEIVTGAVKRSEFVEKRNAFEREMNRFAKFAWTFIVFHFAIASFGSYLSDQNLQTGSFGEWALFAYFTLGLCLYVPVACWKIHRSLRKYGVVCPSCNAQMIVTQARLAITTSRCSTCGQRVLEDD